MDKIVKNEMIFPEIQKEEVLRNLGCSQGTETYSLFAKEYDGLIDELKACVKPAAYWKKTVFPGNLNMNGLKEGDPVLCVLYTLGEEISEKTTEAFSKGDYVKGILLDEIADSALFSLEKQNETALREYCRSHQAGIEGRFQGFDKETMPLQRFIFEELKGEERGFCLSEGLMFSPVKTNAMVFKLTKEEELFRAGHECSRCSLISCKRRDVRQVRLTVIKGEKESCLVVKPGENLLQALTAAGLAVEAPCGGRGRCGKCLVQVKKGVLPPTAVEKERISGEKLKEGWRLACQSIPLMDLTIFIPQMEEERFRIISDRVMEAGTQAQGAWGIGIDIGTTTLVMYGTDLKSGGIFTAWTGVNHQRICGTDVISRIESALKGKGEYLREQICLDLSEGIRKLVKQSGRTENPEKVCIAGNTVMLHLLLGYDCTGLSRAPFVPVSLEAEAHLLSELADKDLPEVPVDILPGMAAFVGADIAAGVYKCDMDIREEICMLIDVGTNGEIVLGNRESLLCASTAAGPAFEGGNISNGMGSLPGAIQSVRITDGNVQVRTILDEPARGICGTGVLEAAAELFQAGILDETGRLGGQFFDRGYPLTRTEDGNEIVLTQKDVREFQLAKAAVRAGIETLLKRRGIRASEVSQVFLAGGFGFSMDLKKAFVVGMFPEGFTGKIRIIGNSSAAGCVKYLTAEDGRERLAKIKSLCREVELSADKEFRDFFMEYMEMG